MNNHLLPRHTAWSVTDTKGRLCARAEALLQHWHDCRGDLHVPTRSAFNPLGLRPWLGSLTIFTAVDDGRDFLVKLDGTDVVSLTGEDWTGRNVSDIDRQFGSKLCEELRSVIGSATPTVRHSQVLQKSWQNATRVCLPVSSGDGRRADQVFKGMFLDHEL